MSAVNRCEPVKISIDVKAGHKLTIDVDAFGYCVRMPDGKPADHPMACNRVYTLQDAFSWAFYVVSAVEVRS